MILNNNLKQTILKKTLIKIKERYLSEEKIYIFLLSGKDGKIIEYIDNILSIIEISIKFYQYRRAIRYILILDIICKKNFNEIALKEKVKAMNI